MSEEQPKCPVDPKTRDIWLQKSKETQAAQQKKIDEQSKTANLINQQSTSASWSFRNILWAAPEASRCPVPHRSGESVCPVPHAAGATMPLDHPQVMKTTFTEPESIECSSDEIDQSAMTPKTAVLGSDDLSKERVISSIPRTTSDGNWVYPSEKQFFNAMLRKNWEPEEKDMKTVVPLHNMVNEVAWKYILKWEEGKGGDECGGIKLTSFKGDAKKLTPRAAINHYVFGKDLPFDRHDWKVDRCGKEIEYVIDFYTTKVEPGEEPKFFLDVRPKLNSLEGVRLRLLKAFGF